MESTTGSSILISLLYTLRDLTPIILVFVVFQFLILRRPIRNLRKVLAGMVYVILGMTCFLVGLDQALFPLGEMMARELTAQHLVVSAATATDPAPGWDSYYWVYIFAASIGFATTIAEPALIAVAYKASEVSGGAIRIWGLRIAVAIGVAFGITLGCYRIISGTPLAYYIIAGYALVIIQTSYAPRTIIALAYDSGGVTTSTVTVPLVTALGIGLASNIPARDPLIDGFGLIAFASLFPMMTVMGYAQLAQWQAQRQRTRNKHSETGG